MPFTLEEKEESERKEREKEGKTRRKK